jgi:hypothetical protein
VDPECLSLIPIFSIPNPGSEFFHPGSRILIKELKYFNQKKWFLSSRKYDPGCSSRIRILTLYPSRIPKGPEPGSGSATLFVLWRDLKQGQLSLKHHTETDISRPGFKPPTSCTIGGRSTRKLLQQLTQLLFRTSTVPYTVVPPFYLACVLYHTLFLVLLPVHCIRNAVLHTDPDLQK